ncbi:hypothetical protein F3Y22_tig00001120pilonHSYRG00269 [Hibiscus syriacus]|uniref:F-box domain-containing protein n=1 Tax=Hibiscus syriacus TaxID=106335 RepID=A0A6A3D2H0_HIBSY|nr:putative FBD-associated F-box protein At5g53635 [Hibiscus syriacus]KAE8733611.1 hypothetical protein F3Y22_tig00001120pilonHSYRG00269 [Hibiscus syriacus]
MSKKVQSVGVLDRLSSLPDHILCRVLSLLPTKDVVRTSIISLRWRYLYASSVSIIDFNDCLPHISVPSENDIIYFNDCLPQFPAPSENDNNFLDFVDRFFSINKQLSLECFRVNDFWVRMDDIQRDEGYLRLNGWICATLWCGVKEIDIRFIYEDVPALPTLLFTCQSLVTLKLIIRGNMKVPSNTCLPNLKTLHFTFSKFQDGYSVLRLISNCNVLENLEFIYCEFGNIRELNIHNLSLKRLVLDFCDLYIQSHRGFNVIEIDTPNLVYFKYVDAMVEGYTLSDMKSLESAHISITLLASVDYERATYLLKRICNVQSLFLAIEDYSSTLFLAPLDPMLAFKNLVELYFLNYDTDDQGTWIVKFLHCMPNLKTLKLSLEINSEGFRSLPTAVPLCLLFHIKEIKIIYFDGDEHTLEMISYFLKHASVLEKLVFTIIDPWEKEESTIIEKLLSLPKKSKKCEIVTP